MWLDPSIWVTGQEPRNQRSYKKLLWKRSTIDSCYNSATLLNLFGKKMNKYIPLILCITPFVSSCALLPGGIPKDNSWGVKTEKFKVHSPLPVDMTGNENGEKININNTLVRLEWHAFSREHENLSAFGGLNTSLLFNKGSFVDGGMFNTHLFFGKELDNKTEAHGILGFGIYAFSKYTGAIGPYIGAGFSHNISRDANIILDYKLHSFKLISSGINLDEIYSASSLSLGVKYRF